ncbi:flagellar filament capping protein FliD [Pseudomonas viridiflava]|uniref:flagellar filament capping protein FliD n=1 Tax=Pseudomonas viridiflava TaxID=33069 RepID=UPI001C31517B|nr:flagellar filament capping protein FliD [Pseudomonas viridiflava]QXG36335.1 flagellar filament capping protein FliD [Pseudomonas viridiflava]
MAITVTNGIGSNVNIGQIVEGLVGAEKAPKQNQINKQTAATTASLSGISQLSAALNAFKKSMETLGSTTTPAFQGFAASSANEGVIKASAGNTAVNGTYAINVKNLATPSKVATAVISATQADAIPSGTIKITQGTTTSNVVIDKTSTLTEVRDKINSSLLGKGISANIITDNNGSRLVFSSTTTGKGSDISVAGDANQGMLSIDGTKLMSSSSTGTDANGNPIPGAGAISDTAQDAVLTIDGLTVTSASNTVSTAISGLKFDLVAPSEGAKTTTVTVATNTDGLKTSLQSFVDSYNTLVKLADTLTKGSVDGEGNYSAAAMSGDATPRAMIASIRTQIATATNLSGLGSLAQLGITTQQSDGTLSLDSVKFTTALNDKKLGSEIQNFFVAPGGLLDRTTKAIDPYIKANGVLDSKSSSLNALQRRLTADQTALDARIQTLTDSLTKKYVAMDALVGKLKAQQNNLTSIFESMAAQQKNS